MIEVTVNKLRKVEYVSLNFKTNVNDLVVSIRRPDGAFHNPNNIVVTPHNEDGIYIFSYTPDVVGLWQEKITSVINGDRSYRNIKVVPYDIEDIKVQLDIMNAKIDALTSQMRSSGYFL
jgi:hypothetical protein